MASCRDVAELAERYAEGGKLRCSPLPWRAGRRVLAASLAAVIAGSLGACQAEQEPAAELETQVLANVNGSEITLTHLQYQLQRETAPYGSLEELRHRALNALVDQELLKQRALANKLDQDPDVMIRIETSRNRLLADAYVQQKVIPQTRIRPEEVEFYYYQNPALFRQRKQYEMTVFNIDRPLPPGAIAALDAADTPVKIVELLREAKIEFQSNAVHRLADQLPLSVVEKFAAASVGDVVVLQGPDGSSVLSLVQGIADAGVSLDESRAAIENYLINIRNRESYAQTLSQIRSGALVEFFGEYSKLNPAAGEDAGTASAPAKAGEPTPLQATEPLQTTKTMEKDKS